jgi:hypothetical protein
MSKLAKALWETHKVELEPTDVVRFEQNYCEPTIVDVVVEDTIAGEKYTFPCFDTSKGIFPY